MSDLEVGRRDRERRRHDGPGQVRRVGGAADPAVVADVVERDRGGVLARVRSVGGGRDRVEGGIAVDLGGLLRGGVDLVLERRNLDLRGLDREHEVRGARPASDAPEDDVVALVRVDRLVHDERVVPSGDELGPVVGDRELRRPRRAVVDRVPDDDRLDELEALPVGDRELEVAGLFQASLHDLLRGLAAGNRGGGDRVARLVRHVVGRRGDRIDAGRQGVANDHPVDGVGPVGRELDVLHDGRRPVVVGSVQPPGAEGVAGLGRHLLRLRGGVGLRDGQGLGQAALALARGEGDRARWLHGVSAVRVGDGGREKSFGDVSVGNLAVEPAAAHDERACAPFVHLEDAFEGSVVERDRSGRALVDENGELALVGAVRDGDRTGGGQLDGGGGVAVLPIGVERPHAGDGRVRDRHVGVVHLDALLEVGALDVPRRRVADDRAAVDHGRAAADEERVPVERVDRHILERDRPGVGAADVERADLLAHVGRAAELRDAQVPDRDVPGVARDEDVVVLPAGRLVVGVVVVHAVDRVAVAVDDERLADGDLEIVQREGRMVVREEDDRVSVVRRLDGVAQREAPVRRGRAGPGVGDGDDHRAGLGPLRDVVRAARRHRRGKRRIPSGEHPALARAGEELGVERGADVRDDEVHAGVGDALGALHRGEVDVRAAVRIERQRDRRRRDVELPVGRVARDRVVHRGAQVREHEREGRVPFGVRRVFGRPDGRRRIERVRLVVVAEESDVVDRIDDRVRIVAEVDRDVPGRRREGRLRDHEREREVVGGSVVPRIVRRVEEGDPDAVGARVPEAVVAGNGVVVACRDVGVDRVGDVVRPGRGGGPRDRRLRDRERVVPRRVRPVGPHVVRRIRERDLDASVRPGGGPADVAGDRPEIRLGERGVVDFAVVGRAGRIGGRHDLRARDLEPVDEPRGRAVGPRVVLLVGELHADFVRAGVHESVRAGKRPERRRRNAGNLLRAVVDDGRGSGGRLDRRGDDREDRAREGRLVVRARVEVALRDRVFADRLALPARERAGNRVGSDEPGRHVSENGIGIAVGLDRVGRDDGERRLRDLERQVRRAVPRVGAFYRDFVGARGDASFRPHDEVIAGNVERFGFAVPVGVGRRNRRLLCGGVVDEGRRGDREVGPRDVAVDVDREGRVRAGGRRVRPRGRRGVFGIRAVGRHGVGEPATGNDDRAAELRADDGDAVPAVEHAALDSDFGSLALRPGDGRIRRVEAPVVLLVGIRHDDPAAVDGVESRAGRVGDGVLDRDGRAVSGDDRHAVRGERGGTEDRADGRRAVGADRARGARRLVRAADDLERPQDGDRRAVPVVVARGQDRRVGRVERRGRALHVDGAAPVRRRLEEAARKDQRRIRRDRLARLRVDIAVRERSGRGAVFGVDRGQPSVARVHEGRIGEFERTERVDRRNLDRQGGHVGAVEERLALVSRIGIEVDRRHERLGGNVHSDERRRAGDEDRPVILGGLPVVG